MYSISYSITTPLRKQMDNVAFSSLLAMTYLTHAAYPGPNVLKNQVVAKFYTNCYLIKYFKTLIAFKTFNNTVYNTK